jgi:hypothetical protein
MNVRNRIKGHRGVRAGELVPHEFNYRSHLDGQKSALRALYAEVGFARSLLAYELPDGRLKLIDGHLRRDLDPDREVEVLDVNDAEARVLLLSIDPLAELAQNQAQLEQRLLELTPTVAADLRLAWEPSVVAAIGQPRRRGFLGLLEATPATVPGCSRKGRTYWPGWASHTFTVPSALALARRLPSPLKVTPVTMSVCP